MCVGISGLNSTIIAAASPHEAAFCCLPKPMAATASAAVSAQATKVATDGTCGTIVVKARSRRSAAAMPAAMSGTRIA